MSSIGSIGEVSERTATVVGDPFQDDENESGLSGISERSGYQEGFEEESPMPRG